MLLLILITFNFSIPKSPFFYDQHHKDEKKEIQKPAVAESKPVPSITKSNSSQKSAIQKQQKLFHQAEQKLAELNTKKQELESKLADPSTYTNATEFKNTESAYQKILSELASANTQYEEIFDRLVKLEEGN